jgi:hypothetical protein
LISICSAILQIEDQPSKQWEKAMTINSTIEALSEAKLDLAAGGMRELIDTELDAVCGGVSDLGKYITKAVDDAISA